MNKKELKKLIEQVRATSKSIEDSVVMSLELEGENVSDTWNNSAFELLLASYQEIALLMIKEQMTNSTQKESSQLPPLTLKSDGEIN